MSKGIEDRNWKVWKALISYSKCNLPGEIVIPEAPKIVLNGLPSSETYEK
jgi:hypothetical protein